MIFEVTPDQVASLSDTDLRTLVGFLAEQEARKAGFSASGVTYGGHQNAKDGGIDVRAEFESGSITGFIPKLSTGYQVKAEDFPASSITKEMRPKGKLRQSIIDLAATGGAYVIVSSKGSVSDTALRSRKKAMKDALKGEPQAAGLHVDFFDRRRIATWVNQHPGLIPWVRSKTSGSLSGWQPFDDWSSSPDTLDKTFIADNNVRLIGVRLKDAEPLDAVSGINQLRRILHEPGSSVRLVGLSGVGKTRLVQALFDERVGENPLNQHDAVYTDLSDSPSPIPQELLGHLINLAQDSILIVDNCGVDLHKKLTAKINKESAQVRLITVEYDISDDEPEHTDTFKLEPASKDMIQKVVKRKYPALTDPEIGTISQFSEGNARVALALAATASHGDSLTNLKDSELIERLFHQKHEKDPALLRTAKALSLVYSFDGETLEGAESELTRLASLTGSTVDEVHGHVAELERRQLVQRRSRWRALLPHALAHKLASQALQDFPPAKVKAALVENATERLLKSFSRRIGCLHNSVEAQKLVGSLFQSGGILSDLANATEIDLVVLENVAPVDQTAVITALHETLDSGKPISNARAFYQTATTLFRALAYEPKYFDEAVKGLLKLAGEQEPSNNSADAASIFKSLFYIHLSGTHAGPEQRIKFLRDLSESDQLNRVDLVFEALDAMLESSYFSSFYSFEFGTRKRDYGYRPKTYGEIWSWYHQVYELAYELSLRPEYRDRIRAQIASAFSFLARSAGPPDKLIELAVKFAADDGWSQGWASARRAARQAKEDKAPEVAKKLDELADKLRPNSLADRIEAYVLPAHWSALDVAEVDLDDDDKYQEAERQADEAGEAVGIELAESEEILNRHLLSILNADQGRTQVTGKGLGRSVQKPKATWEDIVETIKTKEPQGGVGGFLAGYLQGVALRDPSLAGDLLDKCLNEPALHPYFIYLQAVLGLDEKGVARVIEAASKPSVPTYKFRTLGHGRTSDGLDAGELRDVLAAVAGREDGLLVAIDIFHMRIFSKRSDNESILEEERDIGRWLLGEFDFKEKDQQLPSHIKGIAAGCLVPGQDDDLVEALCQRLQAALQSYKIYALDYGKLVRFLFEKFTHTALTVLVDEDDGDGDVRRNIFRHLRDNQPCLLGNVDEEPLLDWANEKPAQRYKRLAEVMRPWSSSENDDEAEHGKTLEWNPRALALLKNAPDKAQVLRTFIASFRPSSWSGSYADLLASRIPLLDAIAADGDEELAKIAREAREKLETDIAAYRKGEEEESRDRDESFEW